MAIDETELTKGQVRKLNALRKSVGDELGEEVFGKWLGRMRTTEPRARPDPIAEKIKLMLSGLEHGPRINLGNYGYTVRWSRGRGGKGLEVWRNSKAK